jgi:protein-arginine deiminase
LSLPKYSSDHNYDDVSQILNDTALRALNEDIQADYIEPNIETMLEEFALTEDDIIRIPMLFEEAAGCGSYTATLLPGTVNMIVAPEAGTGETDLIMPDPFFRQTLNNQSNDPFIEHVESLLPQGSRPHWVDDWEWYHMALGEVHCGSNTKRTPTSNWYESAQHLLGGE